MSDTISARRQFDKLAAQARLAGGAFQRAQAECDKLLAQADWDCGEQIRRHTGVHARVCQVECWSPDTVKAVAAQHARDRRAMAEGMACLLAIWEIEESERARTAIIPQAIAAGVSYGEIPDDYDPDLELERELEQAGLSGLEMTSQEQAERIMEYIWKHNKLPPKRGEQ